MKHIGICAVAFFILSTSVWAGGPWPQPKNKGYFKLSEWWLVFDQHYTDIGKLDPNLTTGVFNTALYGEFGLTDRLTVQGYVPFFSRNTMNNLISLTNNEVLVKGESLNSFGDTDLGLKYGLTKAGAKIPVSASIMLGLPLGNSSAGSQGNLQTGDGEFNQIFQVDAGHGFGLGKKISAYASTYVGFNNRTKGFSDEFRFGLEAGAGFMERKLWLITRITSVESFKNGTASGEITSTSIFANNSEFTSYSLEAAYYITKKIGFSASYASAFRGEIIAARPSYSVGVFYDMNR